MKSSPSGKPTISDARQWAKFQLLRTSVRLLLDGQGVILQRLDSSCVLVNSHPQQNVSASGDEQFCV
jgi:hypothetical protein